MYPFQYSHPSSPQFHQVAPPMTQRPHSGAMSTVSPNGSIKDSKYFPPQSPQAAPYYQAQPLLYGPNQIHHTSNQPVNQDNLTYTKTMGRRGGWEPVMVLLDSIIILGASLFSFYAQHHHFVVNQATLSGKIVNSSNVSALISGVGAVVAAVYVWGLGLLGRMWLYRKVSSGGTVELRQLMAIASRGGLNDLHHALRVAGILFVTTIAISWYIPAAFSGALNPTLAKVSESVGGKMAYLQLTGSGGNATIAVASDCALPNSTCPAKSYYADHYQSLQFAFGYSSYFQSWGAFQNTTPIVPTQFGISSAYEQINRGKLDQYSSVLGSSACVPITQPAVTCVVVLDEPTVKVADGQISYDTPCGTVELVQNEGSQGGSVTSMCELAESTQTTKFYHTVVSDEEGGGTRQLRCDITIQEGFRQIHFWAGDSNWYQDTGSCFERSNNLTHAESRPLISSVVYVLKGAAQQLDRASGSSRNPLYGLVDRAMIDGNFDQLELMIKNGIQTAASVVYGMAYNEANGTLKSDNYAYMDAVVYYDAYSWGTGWKGYVWAVLLMIAATVGAAISTTALFVPRLGYDPGSYAETLFLDKAPLTQDEVDVWTTPLPPRHETFAIALKSK